MSYHLILPFFPEELRVLLLDPSISDLMINGTTGVYVDRNDVIEHIPLATPYTNDRLQAAIERVARILGQDLTTQNPILNTRLPDGSRVAVVGAPSSINGPTLTIRKFNRWYTSDELIVDGAIELLQGKWTVHILCAMRARSVRLSELRREIPFASKKSLTASLRYLEAARVIACPSVMSSSTGSRLAARRALPSSLRRTRNT